MRNLWSRPGLVRYSPCIKTLKRVSASGKKLLDWDEFFLGVLTTSFSSWLCDSTADFSRTFISVSRVFSFSNSNSFCCSCMQATLADNRSLAQLEEPGNRRQSGRRFFNLFVSFRRLETCFFLGFEGSRCSSASSMSKLMVFHWFESKWTSSNHKRLRSIGFDSSRDSWNLLQAVSRPWPLLNKQSRDPNVKQCSSIILGRNRVAKCRAWTQFKVIKAATHVALFCFFADQLFQLLYSAWYQKPVNSQQLQRSDAGECIAQRPVDPLYLLLLLAAAATKTAVFTRFHARLCLFQKPYVVDTKSNCSETWWSTTILWRDLWSTNRHRWCWHLASLFNKSSTW